MKLRLEMRKWQKVKLKDLGQIITGKAPSTKIDRYWGNEFPFITPKDIQTFKHIFRTERYLTTEGMLSVKGSILPKNTVCVSCIGNIGYVSMTTQQSISNQQINSIVVNNKNDTDFVYYLMKSMWLYFKNYEGQSTTLSILNKSQFSKISVVIPQNKKNQQKIASILNVLDIKIELNEKINQNLEAQAQAIFKSWFVDFEPFKNGKFVDSELGKIPESWRVIKFSEFLCPRTEKSNSSTITEYSVTNNGICRRDEKFKKQLSGTKTSNKVIYYADMVFGMSREILNWGLMKDGIGSVSSAYSVFSVNTELVDLSYLEFFMRYHHEYFKSIIRLASREGQGIDKVALFNKCIIIPDVNIIARFLEIFKSLSNLRFAINSEIHHLAQLCDTLLPKLMSGEIDVSDVAV